MSIDPDSPRTEPLERGAFYFAQGGDPGFLFAMDAKAGIAFRRSRLESKWIDHGRYPRSMLEPWASGMTGSSDGVFYSSESGLVRLNEDPEDDGAEVWQLGSVVSAPVALLTSVAVPYLDTDDGLAVAWLQFGGSLRKFAAKGGAEVSPKSPLAAPVVGAGGVVYWIGATGYLTFEVGRTRPVAGWCSWPTGFQAKPWLRPFRAPNGALWALGVRTVDGPSERAATCELTAAIGARELHTLDGPHVSAGGATYRNKSRHLRPWVEAVETVQVGLDLGDRWVLPIVSLPAGDTVVGLIPDAASMRSFLFREGPQPSRPTSIFLHRPNQGLVSMHRVLDLSSTDDLDVFSADGRLCLYNRDINECVSWQLV